MTEQQSNEPKTFSGMTKGVLVALALSVCLALYVWQTQGATHLAVTLTVDSDLERGLVGHWTFDGDDITTVVRDRNSQGNHGYFVGIATTTVPTSGVIGQGVNFTKNGGVGDTDYVSLGSPASLNMIAGAVTVAGWIHMSATTSYNYVFSNARDCCGAYAGFELRVNNQTLRFTLWDGVTNHEVSFSAEPMSLDTWYHVAGTFDGTQLTIYRDGVQKNTLN